MSEPKIKPQPASPNINSLDASGDVDAKYVNMVRIVHSSSELLFDFAHILPGENKAKIQTRILMSPLSAKLFLRAMNENLSKYESMFGEIQIPGDSSLADRLFKPNNPT